MLQLRRSSFFLSCMLMKTTSWRTTPQASLRPEVWSLAPYGCETEHVEERGSSMSSRWRQQRKGPYLLIRPQWVGWTRTCRKTFRLADTHKETVLWDGIQLFCKHGGTTCCKTVGSHTTKIVILAKKHGARKLPTAIKFLYGGQSSTRNNCTRSTSVLTKEVYRTTY